MSLAKAIAPSADIDLWERDRLAALQRFDILDSPREEAFDRITRLIQNIFGVKIGIVSMMDGHRQWYKSAEGMGQTTEVALQETFCRIPLESGEPLVVEDARLDARFADNANVTGGANVRFYASVPLRTHDGHIIGTICAIDDAPRELGARDTKILQDLALIAMNELDLRQRATVDSLTGVLSRRAFKEEGVRAIALAARHRHPLACICFDLDFFKTINDSFGHKAGDKVLVDVTKACAALLRQSDLIGRLGGEEFAILLPYADRQNALDVAEKLRASIAGLAFNFAGQAVSVTASFGVSVIDLATHDIETLLEHADGALYEAKAEGRNCCVGFGTASVPVASPPRRVLKAGMIQFGRNGTIDCTVRTMSDTGAGLDVSATFGIPPKFRLVIRSDQFEKECQIVSQTDRHIEVEFG